ncbi:FtsX-like permease family protein [Janthinobacterium sp.]|uniref:ABC transporter permease n=1 Tax=Janthinobacterium sp. TaxID=1871054 RepID=UPI002583C937|nr:FtsX-like permease family protein [Janthinobacterium sp.]MCX7293671.1 FtsX-like permease family protein [Janthinobacterium sp.]
MNIALLLEMSFKNVLRHGRKSMATFRIMLVTAATLCLLFGYVQANIELIQNAFIHWGARGHLVIERPNSALAHQVEGAGQRPIDAALQATIERVLKAEPAVQAQARILRLSGMVSNTQVTAIFSGIGQDVAAIRQIKGKAYEYDVVAGTPLWMTRQPAPIVLGQGLAAILGCKVPAVGFAPMRPGETPQSRPIDCPAGPLELVVSTLDAGRVNAARYQASAIMDWGVKEINDRLVVLPLDSAQKLMGTNSVSEYHVLLADGADLDASQARLDAALKAAGADTTVFRWSDRATFFQQVRGVLMTFLGFVLIVAALVGFMSLLNSSYMNFMQRRRELATLRSFGFPRRFLLGLTALENAWLALAACLCGLSIAVLVTWSVRAAQIMWTPPGSSNAVPVDIAWVPAIYAISVAGVVLLAMLASWIPTRKILSGPIRASFSDA